MDSERAERHLRLVAEAGLRRALNLPRYDDADHSRTVFTECIATVRGVAMALIAVRAIEADLAEAITIQFQAALAVRHRLHPQVAGSLVSASLRQRSVGIGNPASRTSTTTRSWPAAPPAPAPESAPARAIPAGRMLDFRDDNVAGELYILSMVVTAEQVVAPTVARLRPAIRGASGTVTPVHILPFQMLTATDDKGNAYQVDFSGGREPGGWEGDLHIRPAPPADAGWIELSASAEHPSLRLDLRARPRAPDVTVEAIAEEPGERLLEAVAQRILASVPEGPDAVSRSGRGLGDVVAALEAAGALSPFSLTPGYLATICERLGVARHGITARPIADLPEPWLSVLVAYGRRHRQPVREGNASATVVLPEADGLQVTLAGLHTRGDQTFLHVFVRGLPDTWASAGFDPGAHVGSCWLQDDAGHWHVAVPRKWTGEGDGEAAMALRVLPPLSRDTAWVTLLMTMPTKRMRARVPLSWWASP